MSNFSRRSFLRTGTAAAAAFTIAPSSILGKSHGYMAPTDKLNIAGVGVGARGAQVLRGMETENIVALCDVDWAYSKATFEKYPTAKTYYDYRKMYDEMGSSIDAVMIGTADHTHAIITADAMTMGKHVYTEKPLTHSVYESRLLTKLAEKYQVATQMGNQGASNEGVNLICEWIWNDEIGEITKVEAQTNRPSWPQGLNPPTKAERTPRTLDWDLFIGPAKYREYHSVYHPWNWRGLWDFGTGALGDMACHILHPVFKALKLQYPTKVQGSSTYLLQDYAPWAQHMRLIYPRRDNLPKVTLPEVEVNWCDGGFKIDMPEGWPEGKSMNSVIFHGTKDKLICSDYGANPWLLSGRVPNAPKTERRIEGDSPHQQDWIRACKESAASRVKTKSDFSEAGPFNEMVVMGVLSTRLQGLNKILEWDGPNMRFTNIKDDEEIRFIISNELGLRNGRQSYNTVRTEPINAKSFAAELIQHNYRDGWKLVDMPR